jgi:excisionase family DNA binding protein
MKRDEKLLYTADNAANALDVSRCTIYRWMSSGHLKWVIIGTDRRIPATEIKRIVQHGLVI